MSRSPGKSRKLDVWKPLTTARERGSDIIDLQDFAGHADPRTTLTYIRKRDRLSKSPAYVLKY
jgi:integrase/recombinase XerD